MTIAATPISYPLRPINGGRFDLALPKTWGSWAAEPKYNGWRAVLHLPSGQMWNRKGEPLSIAGSFSIAIDMLRGRVPDGVEWIDVEALERRHDVGKGTLIVLDYMIPQTTYRDRRVLIESTLPILEPCTEPENNSVYATASVSWDQAEKLWDDLKKYGETHKPLYEGIVAKETDSIYPFQTLNPSTTFPRWIKHRFLK